MAEYDPFTDDVRETLEQISTEYAQAFADYKSAGMCGDDQARRDALRRMGAANAEYVNGVNLYNQHWQQQHPPAPPQPSAEERKARTWDRMDWQDVVDLARQSKYARDIRPERSKSHRRLSGSDAPSAAGE